MTAIPIALDPQMIAVMDKRRTLTIGLQNQGNLSVDDSRNNYNHERAWWNAIKPKMDSVEELSVPGPRRDIALRIYRPFIQNSCPTLLYLHGGGWVVGNLDTHDRVMRLLAQFSGAAVVGIDYALSPEHKFPVAINETLAVIQWLESSGHNHGLDPTRLALGGDSAGANMAVAVTQLHHQQDRQAIRFLLLYYGAYGLTDSWSWQQYGNADYEFTREDKAFYLDSYLANPGDHADSRFNVLSGNIACLPQAFIAAAEYDPLHDDSVALHEAMRKANRPAHLEVYTGVLHSFIHYSRLLDKATQALRDGAHALTKALS
ncbi:alpha/beta hydrolase fold domain-containing protein [Gammaproteobacteria bacterium]|nr:alpha/beta hydrolase fold domain-containing protein [Gammaproteobacteria bacterium]